MPSISAGRIQSGTGAINFSSSTTATTGTGLATPATTTTNTTLTLSNPSTGTALFDSMTQSSPADNNITLALRNIIGGSNITVTNANGLITIASTVPTGPTGPAATFTHTDGITAGAAATQSTAVLLTTALNRITTVSASTGSVQLPSAVAGLIVTVINAAATNGAYVYSNYNSGSPVDQINGATATTAYTSLTAGKTATFYCAASGQWDALLSA